MPCLRSLFTLRHHSLHHSLPPFFHSLLRLLRPTFSRVMESSLLSIGASSSPTSFPVPSSTFSSPHLVYGSHLSPSSSDHIYLLHLRITSALSQPWITRAALRSSILYLPYFCRQLCQSAPRHMLASLRLYHKYLQAHSSKFRSIKQILQATPSGQPRRVFRQHRSTSFCARRVPNASASHYIY